MFELDTEVDEDFGEMNRPFNLIENIPYIENKEINHIIQNATHCAHVLPMTTSVRDE